MQIVYRVELDADEYAASEAHLKVRRPLFCPHCRKRKALVALGFYRRSSTVSGSGTVVSIKVRRFVCASCRRTVSLLPSFAQPYRLVCSRTIEQFFNDEAPRTDTLHWQSLLRRYWRTFTKWLPKLVKIIGRVLGLPPPISASKGSWDALVAAYGRLDRATRILVHQFQVTAFGKYRCHGPVPSQK